MKIFIPFNEWSKERLANQTKKATSRYRKYGNVGDTFEVDDCEYQLELVIKLPLWFIAEELYLSEGAKTIKEFIDIWKDIHQRKGYRPFDEVWYHHFKEVNVVE